MAGMILMPTQDGLKELKEHTKESLQKVEFLDANKKKFYEFDIFTSFYDGNGVLTALFDVPSELNLTIPTHFVNVVANNKVIAAGELPTHITFVKGVGGVQTIKFPISSKAGEVVFKNNNFITEVEFKEQLSPKLIAHGGDGISIDTTSGFIVKTITLPEAGSYVLHTRLTRIGNDDKDDAYLSPSATNATTRGFYAYVGEFSNPAPDYARVEGNGTTYIYVSKNDLTNGAKIDLTFETDGSNHFIGSCNYTLLKISNFALEEA